MSLNDNVLLISVYRNYISIEILHFIYKNKEKQIFNGTF